VEYRLKLKHLKKYFAALQKNAVQDIGGYYEEKEDA